MKRELQGHYVTISTVGEEVRAFVPAPLPPNPPIEWTPEIRSKFDQALLALGRAHEGAGDPSSARETYRRGVDVAAARGDLATANKMQERLVMLDAATTLE